MKYLTYILAGLLLIACIVIAWFWYNPRYEKVFVEIKPKPQVTYIERTDGGNVATLEVAPTATLSQEYIRYVNDTLIPSVDKGLLYKAEVTELTRVNAMLKDSLSRNNVVINNTRKDVIQWKTKYIDIASNHTDSTASYAYNADLSIIGYRKKESLFGPKKDYISVTSPDKNFRVNGFENYTMELKQKKDWLHIDGKIQGFYLDKTITPYAGIELIFAPDAKISPNVSVGYIYNPSTGKTHQFFSGGLQFNLIRF